ncbi:hypothetical protein DH2020_022489 [Rehmannia glutinosa]|uniref:Uncharacterized protein n=1 Tax=Rehmannia glutinosa TaxID=99300 RepID=A0ABR0WHX4_REHGL
MTISLPSTVNDESRIQSLFPLCILLARPVYRPAVVEDSAVYRFSRECILTKCTGDDRMNQDQASFILPEINKLSAEVKSGSLSILFVSCAELFKEHADGSLFPGSLPFRLHAFRRINQIFNSRGEDHLANVAPIFGGTTYFHAFLHIMMRAERPGNNASLLLLILDCISFDIKYLKIYRPLVGDSLDGIRGKSPLTNCHRERAEMLSTVDLHSCFLKTSCFGEDKCFSFHSPHAGTMAMSQQLQVRIAAEELGAKERSPYDSFSYSDIPSSTLPQIIRLRTGNVVFNYKYYNNKLQRTEVTEDFTCPFCLVKCASFKVTEEFQAVNVSVKTDTWRSEIVAAGVDPKQQTFFFCSKAARRRKLKSLVQRSKHVQPLVIDSELPGSINELREKTDEGIAESGDRDASSPRVSSATAHSFADPECIQSLPGSNLAPPALLQFAKTRKLSIERSDPRNRALLQKRQFFHSHRAQVSVQQSFGLLIIGCLQAAMVLVVASIPMAMEQVLSDRDSEDEVDDDVADLEDRRMLDDFVDVTKDEKQLMHLWNSFVRKQRVLADGHIPWACEAFSKLHRQDLVRTPALQWCWRLFMIKLWNHGLLDARTMNNCNIILEQYQGQDIDP